MTKHKIKVLLLEDNRLLREGIRKMLSTEPDMKVIASTGKSDVFKKVLLLNPDIVLLDLGLKDKDCLTFITTLKEKFPDTYVVVMDLIPAHAEVVDFVKAGVAGFVLKDATLDELLHTIRSVVKGAKVLPPPMVGSLFSQIVEHAIQSGKVEELMSEVRLTRREKEVIAQIADGKSNKEIASKLNLAVYTVKSHVHNILEKLALNTRLEVSSFAHARGLANIDPDKAS